MSNSKEKNDKEKMIKKHNELFLIIHELCDNFFIEEQLLELTQILLGYDTNMFLDIVDELIEIGLINSRYFDELNCTLYTLSKTVIATLDNKLVKQIHGLKITPHKIITRIYALDFILTDIIPQMEDMDIAITRTNICEFLSDNFITLFYNENPSDILKLYNQFNKHLTTYEQIDSSSGFGRDFHLAIGNDYIYRKTFLQEEFTADYSKYTSLTNLVKRNKQIMSDTDFHSKYYCLTNFVKNNFVFNGKLNEYGLEILMFDTNRTLTVRKVYRNIAFIFLMIKRYLGKPIPLTFTIVSKNRSRIKKLELESTEFPYDCIKGKHADHTRAMGFLYRCGLNKSDLDYLSVYYYTKDFKKKYDIE